MTLVFDGPTLEPFLRDDVALRAMDEAFLAESRGATRLPTRIDTPSGRGFIRVMPAVFDDVMGLKVMTLVEGSGNRYLVLLYGVENGELLALFDAEELTRLRTAATTAIGGKMLAPTPPRSLAVIGTGFEAVGHLRMFVRMWPIERVVAHSPNAERRERFAAAMSAELGIEVVAAPTPDAALAGQPCVILATKAKLPVIDGAAFAPGAVVLSIGSTRLDLRELDDTSLRRAAVVVVDHVENVLHESADIADNIANGNLRREQLLSMSAIAAGAPIPSPHGDRDLLVLKTVGTALQDLALARALYRDPAARAAARDIGEVTALKPFSAKAFAAAPAAHA